MANAPQGQKNQKYRSRISFLNGETTNPILPGTPVLYSLTSGATGFSMVNPSTLTTQSDTLCAGIAEPIQEAGPGEWFDTVITGFAENVRLLRATRAATTDAWPTLGAISVGDLLSIFYAQDCLQRASAGTTSTSPSRFVFAGNPKATGTNINLASAATASSDAYPEYADAVAMIVPARVLVRAL